MKYENAHTLDEIAKLAGTTKSTVSRVLSNHPRISEKTRKRVLQVVEQQHYRPNLFARALAGGKTGLIGVISSNIGSGFYAEVIRGIDIVFNQLGKRLMVSIAHFEKDYEALWQDIVWGGRIEGLVVLAPTSDFYKLNVDSDKVPMVICAGNPPKGNSHWKNVNRIGMNNERAMEELITNLAGQGCRRVLHAAGWGNNSDAVERKAAFIKAAKKNNIAGIIENFGITQPDGRSSMTTFLSQTSNLPDAIVCFNDSIALGVLEAWHVKSGQHRNPPFALTGWDDSPSAAAIGLTSVSIPFTLLGEESARLLHRLIDQKESPSGHCRRIDLEIMHRGSSRVQS